MKINYLVIEGNIGSGKTTLTNLIARDYGARTLLEGFDDNPFLPKFYKEPEKYAFPLEMSFLADRYNQLSKNIRELELFSSFLVSDYYFMKSLIFAQNTLSAEEYHLYNRFFKIVYDKLPKPDLYVYLHADVEKLLRNIRKRGRNYEKGIDSEYLEKISKGYFSFFRQQQDFPVLVIDTNNIDFVTNTTHYRSLIGIIFDKAWPPGMSRVLID
ncbi:deoxynucleoside kinase [Gaoshiqia sediminis]|uniref:Deoxynucleoside kinase n=1 Tax=Gaoshiqia sediminis TaxID=2986998 RepID=A0AA41Y8W0_9BACT|nr:deoxynucleoside kinase [Gaoshiqia sediminis]MCW0484035.1 deoxynucleoside kinase [Gaoshiqia sediminis]